jgi:hypothetical protein
MVDFTEFKIGSKVRLRLSDETTQEYVVAVVDEIEWNLHRHPSLVDLKIESSTDEEKWPPTTKILLNVKIEENTKFKFILKCPCEMQPNKEETRYAAFCLEEIIIN